MATVKIEHHPAFKARIVLLTSCHSSIWMSHNHSANHQLAPLPDDTMSQSEEHRGCLDQASTPLKRRVTGLRSGL